MSHRALAPVLVAVGIIAAGCGGTGRDVDATCDQVGIQETITHIVNEAALQFGEFEQLSCSGDWAVATAAIDGEGGGSQLFIFQHVGPDWVLKAPELVCGSIGADPSLRPEDAHIPAELWSAACAELTAAE